MDQPNVPAVLCQREQAETECVIDADEASYFVSTIDLYRGDAPGLRRWRKKLFWPPRTSPPAPPITSAYQATTPSSWAHESRCSSSGLIWSPSSKSRTSCNACVSVLVSLGT